MLFPSPLARGTLIQRYKRFLADVRLDTGETVTATCPNTGSMLGLTAPGSVVWLSISDSPTRKYRHTWELIENDLGSGPQLVGVNTGHPNKLVTEAIEAGRIAELAGYSSLKREQKYGVNSRIDILLGGRAGAVARTGAGGELAGGKASGRQAMVAPAGDGYVEIKNVHLMRTAGLAEFPDSVTARGAKHLGELAEMVKAGHRAVMVYLIQRPDARHFRLARDIDPDYAAAFEAATGRGVEAIALACAMSIDGITVDGPVEIAERMPVRRTRSRRS